MKQLIFLMAVLLMCTASCKKDQGNVPSCRTGNVFLAGTYAFHDTISISFSGNRCPVENSNKYVIHGLKLPDQPTADYEIISQPEIDPKYILGDEVNGKFTVKYFYLSGGTDGPYLHVLVNGVKVSGFKKQ